MSIQIKPLPTIHEEPKSLLHKAVPQGSCLITAPSNSGKTVLMVNLMLRIEFGVLIHYDTIYVYSPTCRSDASWDLVQPDVYRPHDVRVNRKKHRTAEIELRETLDEDEIVRVMDENSALPREERKKILMIIDDFAAEIKSTIALNRLVMRGRHSYVWTWISTQLYRKIPRSVRVNMPYYIFFAVNQNELKTIAEELGTNTFSQFETIFRRCTDAKYSFLGVNMKRPVSERYSCNFEKI